MTEFDLVDAGGCVATAALHVGHEMRGTLGSLCLLDPLVRLREEDPHTDTIADVGVSRIVAHRSRFEVDLNRPRSHAVYRDPADAWGLDVWRDEPSTDEVDRSLAIYDRFHSAAGRLLDASVAAHGAAVVFDVHSYNHRRGGPGAPPDDPSANPEVNVGTGTLDTERWSPLVARTLGHFSAAGLDARENIRFLGGHFPAWAHRRYRGRVAVIALEFKKTFMDEWTGEVDIDAVKRLRAVLAGCVPIAEDAVAQVRL